MLKTIQYSVTNEDRFRLIQMMNINCDLHLSYMMAPIISQHAEDLKEKLLSANRKKEWEYKEALVGIPDFHYELYRIFNSFEHLRTNVAIPRGFSKTTLAKLSCMYLLIFSPIRFAIICNDVRTKAVDSMLSIIDLFLSERYRSLFGDIEVKSKNLQDGSVTLIIIDKNLQQKEIHLKALGVKGSARGSNKDNFRPDYILTDDIQKSDDSGTGSNFSAVSNFFFGTLINAGTEMTKITNIGNFTEQRSIINELQNREDFKTYVFGALDERGQSRWEYQHSTLGLKRQFNIALKTGKEKVFLAEFMNKPYNETVMEFDPKLVLRDNVSQDPLFYDYRLITVDPAFTNNSVNDEAAITVHGYHIEKDMWYMVEQVAGRWADPFDLAEIIVNMSITYMCPIIEVESNNGQSMLADIIERVARDKGHNLTVIRKHTYTSKNSRIKAMMGMLANQRYTLPFKDNNILLQFSMYDFSKTKNADDRIDSLSMILNSLGENSKFIHRDYYLNGGGRIIPNLRI